MNVRGPNGRVGRMLAMEASVKRGDSGSPIVRVRDGTVLGLLSGRDLPDGSGVSHTAYAVRLDEIRSWLDAAEPAAAQKEEFYLTRIVPGTRR
jgi:hypothetical protein